MKLTFLEITISKTWLQTDSRQGRAARVLQVKEGPTVMNVSSISGEFH